MSWRLLGEAFTVFALLPMMVNIWASVIRRKTVEKWSALAVAILYTLSGLAMVMARDPGTAWWRLLCGAAFFWDWWKSGGGDDWRKTKSRVTSAIREVAGRLSVVPVPAGGAA